MAASSNSSGQPPSGDLQAESEFAAGTGPRTRIRFLVFLMTFAAVVINYMDRANFNVSAPLIEKHFGFNIADIGRISFIWGLARRRSGLLTRKRRAPGPRLRSARGRSPWRARDSSSVRSSESLSPAGS